MLRKIQCSVTLIIKDFADNTSKPRYRSCHWYYLTLSTLAHSLRSFTGSFAFSTSPLLYITVRLYGSQLDSLRSYNKKMSTYYFEV